MSIKESITNAIVRKCEDELNYYDVVNESAEMVEYDLIVEFILDAIFSVWSDEDAD